MVKKQYLKSTGRMFLKHFVRLISISAIFLVTVSLISGLGDVENNIYRTIDASYHQDNIHDFAIRSMPLLTPRSEVLKLKDTLNDPQVKEQLGINEVEEYYSFDIPDIATENYSTRLIYYDFTPEKTNRIDKLEIIDIAKRIDTYETSILPYEDCCTIFDPKNPVTKPKLDKCEYYESKFEWANLVQDCINGDKIIKVSYRDGGLQDECLF